MDILLFAVPFVVVLAAMLVLPGGEDEHQPASAEASPSATRQPTPEPTETLPLEFQPGSDFEPVPTPGPNDWLAVHREYGQSFRSFVSSRPNLPDDTRHRLYLLPLNDFPPTTSPPLEALGRYAAAFFGLEVEVLTPVTLDESEVRSRINDATYRRQLLTGDILALLKGRLPDDGFCLLGITMEDIYSGPDWNFVFGQASLRDRVAVYSFCRYDPVFYGDTAPDPGAVMLRRSLKVLAHETAHMFGILHCTAYSCVMNGSNHLQESDSRPFHLCPIDLRKLQWSVGFDVRERYQRLETVYRECGMEKEMRWVERRLRNIK